MAYAVGKRVGGRSSAIGCGAASGRPWHGVDGLAPGAYLVAAGPGRIGTLLRGSEDESGNSDDSGEREGTAMTAVRDHAAMPTRAQRHRVAALMRVIGLYQVLRAGRPSPCRFVPSCSDYAREALERHGSWRGGILALRRVGPLPPAGPPTASTRCRSEGARP